MLNRYARLELISRLALRFPPHHQLPPLERTLALIERWNRYRNRYRYGVFNCSGLRVAATAGCIDQTVMARAEINVELADLERLLLDIEN